MIPWKILQKHFHGNSEAFDAVATHSRMVAQKALLIARAVPNREFDLPFIEEASLLHDIGVSRIHAPDLNCFGKDPYICHGILGRQILEDEGLPRHALVCERHIGVGLSAEEITQQKLPLPPREMTPVTDEERIVTLADLFFSKKKGELSREKSVDEVRQGLTRFGADKVVIFDRWLAHFGIIPVGRFTH